MIPAGAHNTTLKICDGVPKWVFSTCGGIQIGDTGPGGGIVFYVDSTGAHGYEAAPGDVGIAPWGCSGTVITGGTVAAPGTGAQNTTNIVADCPDPGIAAEIADTYTTPGFTDWYLPSKDELDLLHDQKTIVGGFNGDYWSSTEDADTQQAWSQDFDDPSGSGQSAADRRSTV